MTITAVTSYVQVTQESLASLSASLSGPSSSWLRHSSYHYHSPQGWHLQAQGCQAVWVLQDCQQQLLQGRTAIRKGYILYSQKKVLHRVCYDGLGHVLYNVLYNLSQMCKHTHAHSSSSCAPTLLVLVNYANRQCAFCNAAGVAHNQLKFLQGTLI